MVAATIGAHCLIAAEPAEVAGPQGPAAHARALKVSPPHVGAMAQRMFATGEAPGLRKSSRADGMACRRGRCG